MSLRRRQISIAAAATLAAPWVVRAQAGNLAALHEAAKKEGELTWYTVPQTSEVAEKMGRSFTARYPGVKFVWVMGADSLASFHRWRGWTQIMREVPVAVISRPWAGLKSRTSPAARRFAHARKPASAAATLPDQTAPAWVYLTGPLNFASSTALRDRQTKGG